MLGEKVQCIIREQRWEKKNERAGIEMQGQRSRDGAAELEAWIRNRDEEKGWGSKEGNRDEVAGTEMLVQRRRKGVVRIIWE